MKKSEVKINGRYMAKVSGFVVPIRIIEESPHGGWNAISEPSNRPIRIKTAARLRGPAPKKGQ